MRRSRVIRGISGARAVRQGAWKEVRVQDELGKIGVQKEGANEQIPRSTRGEQYDASTENSIRHVPRCYRDLFKRNEIDVVRQHCVPTVSSLLEELTHWFCMRTSARCLNPSSLALLAVGSGSRSGMNMHMGGELFLTQSWNS